MNQEEKSGMKKIMRLLLLSSLVLEVASPMVVSATTDQENTQAQITSEQELGSTPSSSSSSSTPASSSTTPASSVLSSSNHHQQVAENLPTQVATSPEQRSLPASGSLAEVAMTDSVMQVERIAGSLARGDDYPYRHIPFEEDYIDPWRLYHRQCTSFVAWRLQEINGFLIPGAYGNAVEWKDRAQREGYRVDQTPALGSIAYWSAGQYGHVSWVAGIQGDNVEIEEYNYGNRGNYNRRIVPISQVEAFIHFKDVQPLPPLPKGEPGSIYRLYQAESQQYFYTKSLDEAAILKGRGWKFEGRGFKTAESGKPVYRLYHAERKAYLYTSNVFERNKIVQEGWKYEGIAWYSQGTTKVYRLFNPHTKVHMYTTSTKEVEILQARGWKYEGVTFYTLP